jgi:putative endonuclease
MDGKSNRERGEQAELLACRYLQAQGLHLLRRNYRCRLGEIDLIMKDNASLVFVEVRYRRKGRFGGPLESVTLAKQRRLIATAQYYLQLTGGTQSKRCRFDVVAITSAQENNNPDILWLRDAFQIE